MKRPALIAIMGILLVLDFAALDDITTGNEPSLFGEYLIVFASVPTLLVVGYLIYRNRKSKRKLSS